MSSYAKHLATTPYWIDSASMPRFPPVTRDERADVVVVGGGVAGLTTAYLIVSAGRSVVVLERDRCAQVDTGHTSAHLTMVLDEPLTTLAAHFGSAHAQAAWDAGLAAIAQIDEIVRDEQIACGFDWVPGYLHAPWNDQQPARETFEREANLAHELGFDASYVDDVPVVGGPGVRFEDQARIHPRKYLAAVARAITARGGRIYEHSEAQEFKDSPRSVRVNDHTITCGDIVLATHNPLVGLNNIVLATLFQTKLALYTTYVIAGRVKRGTVPDALFWDNGDPYYYLRVEPHRDHDVVIFGGQDHKTGQADDTEQCYTRLEQTLKAILPGIDLTNRWSGQVIETPDGLPYIGESADHQFSGTGFSGNGLTFGTLTGMMARDHIVGRKNPWTELFDVNRTKVVGGLWDYVKENSDYPYYLIRDRFAGPEGRSLRAVKRGEGKILEIDGARVAAYRRDDGRTIVRSALCTHMGCLVEWNDAERTWDCPCHGSRFQPTGEVIAGPAESPLGEPGSKS